jgi:hypothetical protein
MTTASRPRTPLRQRSEGHALQRRPFPDERFVSGALTHYCKMSWITARRAVLPVSPWSFARSGIIKSRSARDPTLCEIVGENAPSCSLRQGAAA